MVGARVLDDPVIASFPIDAKPGEKLSAIEMRFRVKSGDTRTLAGVLTWIRTHPAIPKRFFGPLGCNRSTETYDDNPEHVTLTMVLLTPVPFGPPRTLRID